jgi:voltage-gated potassium channel Kch
MTAVPYLFQRDALRRLGATRVIALTPEGTLSFGKLVLGELGITADGTDTIINALRADDYAFLRGIGAMALRHDPTDAEKR